MEERPKGKFNNLIDGAILIGIGVTFTLILIGVFGRSGKVVTDWLIGVFGYGIYGYSIAIAIAGVLRLFKFKPKLNAVKIIGLVLAVGMTLGLLHVISSNQFVVEGVTYKKYLLDCYMNPVTAGGILGAVFIYPVLKFNYIFAVVGTSMLTLLGYGILIFTQFDINKTIDNKSKAKAKATMTDFNNLESEYDNQVVGNDLFVYQNVKEKSAKASSKGAVCEYISLDEIAEKRELEQLASEQVEIKNTSTIEDNAKIKSAIDLLYGNPNIALSNGGDSVDEYTNNYKRKTIKDRLLAKSSQMKSSEVKTPDTVVKEILNSSTPVDESPIIKNKTGADFFDIEDIVVDRKKLEDDKPNREESIGETKYVPLVDSLGDSVIDKTERRPIESFQELLARKKLEREQREESEKRAKHDYKKYSRPIEEVEANRDSINSVDEEGEELGIRFDCEEESSQVEENITSSIDSLEGGYSIDMDKFDFDKIDVNSTKNSYDSFVSQVPKEVSNNITSTKGNRYIVGIRDENGIEVRIAPYKYPPIELLKDYKSKVDNHENYQDKIKILEDKLSTFNINAKVVNIVSGPTFTRLELQMPNGVSVNKIAGYANDISMCLESDGVRCQIPIPNKNAFGVELPNKIRGIVGLKQMITCQEFQYSNHNVSFVLGQDCDGNNYIADLSKMPHLLIAGATGAGKSVCLNTLICSLLYKYSPEEVRLLLVDPKQIEFDSYNGIPHMLIPESVVTKEYCLNLLDWAIEEMELRYSTFKLFKGIKDIKSYNNDLPMGAKKMPYIVVIVDEVGDFMLEIRKELEERITKLTQKARAAGIILVLATQRPSVDVITGLIKSNLPSRIAFAVPSFMDSRTIIDQNGAEKLLRDGDMLFMDGSLGQLNRIQGAFISGKEVSNVCDYIRDNNTVYFDPDITNAIMTSKSNSANPPRATFGDKDFGVDKSFVQAILHAIDLGGVSISMLQRRFGWGFPKAGRVVDTMSELGIIGAEQKGNRLREILWTREQVIEKYGDIEEN